MTCPFSPHDFKEVNAVEHIRRHPDMYLPGGEVRAEYLASRLVEDVLMFGATDAFVKRVEDWWVIGSPYDWLPHESDEQLIAVFNTIVPFPQAGANAMRSEILVTAFAKEVISAKDERRIVIAGSHDPGDLAWKLVDAAGTGRIVAFRMNSGLG